MILINVLIVLLIILIIFYLSGAFMRFLSYLGLRFREGLEPMGDTGVNNLGKSTFTDPGLNDNPLYLATINAANINYLKEQVDELSKLKQQVTALEPKVAQNTAGIAAMGDQFAQSAQQLTGRDPNSKEPIPSVTGLN
jgi:hypothetical protein